jgi:DNA modification methylase
MPTSIKPFINKIICGDAYEVLKQLPPGSVNCVVTSPPYWALRDYGVDGQLGLEANFRQYVEKLCDIFDEVKRVLKPSGSCWLVLGDTYSTRNTSKGKWSAYLQTKASANANRQEPSPRPATELPGKCLLLIPSRVAIEMISRGWILRNELIWWKPNAMPSSAKDRFTMDFEKIFFFVKSRRYFFMQQFETLQDLPRAERRPRSPTSKKRRYGDPFNAAINPKTAEASRLKFLASGRNKRAVWSVATKPFRGPHFAVYPPELIETTIQSECLPNGITLDPFVRSGTTALAARKLGRHFIGIDLNPTYVQIAKKRLLKK